MNIVWDTSKNARRRTRNTFLNLLLTALISGGLFIIFSIFMRCLSSAKDAVHPQLLTWWVNTKYGQSIGMLYMLTREDLQLKLDRYEKGSLDPNRYNYTLTISEHAQWPQPNFHAKYQSLLNDVRNDYHIHRRSHIQRLGTRVTCWPRSYYWEDNGFYSRHVSPAELDWLELPRFQDTLRSQDQFAEDIFCYKFKQLLPFYYKNSTWYPEIVKLDEKHTRSQLLGCEPGFLRTIEGGIVTDIEKVECYKRSPYAFFQKDGDQETLWYLKQSKWAIDDDYWYGGSSGGRLEVGSECVNDGGKN